MGLVDYSESDSSGDETTPVAPKKASQQQQQLPGAKKPFQKVVDRSNPGKIVVNLPSSATSNDSSHTEEPPAKRARIGGGGGGAFSGFNSFLPAPKNANNKGSSGAISKPKPGVSLKTSAGPGFSRDGDGDEARRGSSSDDPPKPPSGGLGLNLPPPKRPAEPSIPEGQKAAEDVKLVGKPLMFKPLSVARNPNKKKNKTPKPAAAPNQGPTATTTTATTTTATNAAHPPPPKKTSLFSMYAEEHSEPWSRAAAPSETYEPLFETAPSADGNTFDDYDYSNASHQQAGHFAPSTGGGNSDSVDNVAADLNLSAAERRELFGRDGPGALQASKVINFNMDTEYRHNEELRASGQEQAHNPVRAIQGGGKHSLRQLVQNVRSQKDALEDSFAKGRSNRKEASSRYGW
jgi:hypothetical protein